jgi:hypothetical protein
MLIYNPKRRRNVERPQLRWRDQLTLQDGGDDDDDEEEEDIFIGIKSSILTLSVLTVSAETCYFVSLYSIIKLKLPNVENSYLI